jgi:hypothetical protein
VEPEIDIQMSSDATAGLATQVKSSIEKKFDLRFTDEEILSNVMVSLSGIVSLVSQKKAA